jgi:2-polyprenyl-3-methyl-5-hydroxy-6-metoxy-1,4-benzoquinol methylase
VEPPYFERRLAFVLEQLGAGEAPAEHRTPPFGERPAEPTPTREVDERRRPLRVLDVGCGEGHFAAALGRAGMEVMGMDVAAVPLRRARTRQADLDLCLLEAEDRWPLRDASFDAVWAGEVIEHVTDTAGWFSELRRVLRSGGRLLLSTPAHDRLTVLGLALRRRAFAEHFEPRSDHVRFYSRRSLTELLCDFGFEEPRIRGLGGVPGARRSLLGSARRSRY